MINIDNYTVRHYSSNHLISFRDLNQYNARTDVYLFALCIDGQLLEHNFSGYPDFFYITVPVPFDTYIHFMECVKYLQKLRFILGADYFKPEEWKVLDQLLKDLRAP